MSKETEYKFKQNLEKLSKNKPTNFLDPFELKQLTSYLPKNSYQIYYPYPDSEKNILYKNIKPEIYLLKIDSPNPLKHKDILGSLFSLNISPNFYGDIIIDNTNYYLIVSKEIKNYILDNLTLIGNNYITIKEVNINLIKDYHHSFEENSLIVKSLRIDCVLSTLLNLSRSQIKEKINNKDIFLNYNLLTNNSYTLKENDVFSVRKYGKFKYLQIITTTKKNNLIIKYQKYI